MKVKIISELIHKYTHYVSFDKNCLNRLINRSKKNLNNPNRIRLFKKINDYSSLSIHYLAGNNKNKYILKIRSEEKKKHLPKHKIIW